MFKKGFSLVELLVVMAIIGIISATGIPAYKNYQKRARIKSHKSTLMSLHNAALTLDATETTITTDELVLAVKGVNEEDAEDDNLKVSLKSGNKNIWCVEYKKTDLHESLHGCVNQDGEVNMTGEDKEAPDSKDSRAGKAKGVCSGGYCT